jgi:anti-anti-sigma factor
VEITRTLQPGSIDLAISGRLDSYWADHLDTAISEVIREGHDCLRLDLSETSFLSSAGIAVLVKHYKQLVRLNGSLLVSKASEPVRFVLEMSRLTTLLCDADAPAAAAPAAPAGGRSLERGGAHFDIVELDPKGSLTCRAIGDPARLGAPGTDEGHEVTCRRSMFMLGIGSLGGPFEECRDRFGDLLAVGGAIVYQPADGTNMPDYMVAERASGERGSAAPPAPEARMMYGLVCDGSFASLGRFESTGAAPAIDLPTLAETCLEISGAPAAGVVVVAEVAGLVGAALRQSPFALAGAGSGGGFFAHPQVRERLTFTAERAFARSVALVAGVVARPDAPGDHSQLRPIGGAAGLVGHFHAAAFPFLPFRKGRIDLHDTVTSLFESERVLGVLHLLHDDRATNGAGANEFIRGACWASPIRSWG